MAFLPMISTSYVAPSIDLALDTKAAVTLFKVFPDKLRDELQARAPRYLSEVRPHMPRYTGGLQRSGKVTNTTWGATISFTVPAQRRALWASYRSIHRSVGPRCKLTCRASLTRSLRRRAAR